MSLATKPAVVELFVAELDLSEVELLASLFEFDLLEELFSELFDQLQSRQKNGCQREFVSNLGGGYEACWSNMQMTFLDKLLKSLKRHAFKPNGRRKWLLHATEDRAAEASL